MEPNLSHIIFIFYLFPLGVTGCLTVSKLDVTLKVRVVFEVLDCPVFACRLDIG